MIITCASPIGGDGEAEELIAIADEGSATAGTGADRFVGVQLKPNPHKRSAYKVLESVGLHSHFGRGGSPPVDEDAPFYLHDNTAIDGAKADYSNSFARSKREANEKTEKTEKDFTGDAEKAEALPSPAAQSQEPGYYRRARSRLSEDSMAQASGGDAGLRRVPRVNFVTQPRNLDELPEHRDLKASNANMDPMYRRPPAVPVGYDSYMPVHPVSHYGRQMGRGRFFDGNYGAGGYDRYDSMERERYDPYYYSSASRYQNQNQMMYNGGNGYYNGYYSADRRYPEYPEMRNPYAGGGSYMNDVNYMGNPNRRVVYYAHLPEVVRQNPYGETRGGYYASTRNGGGGGYYGGATEDRYDDPYYNRSPYMDDYNYRYNRDMNQFGMPPLPQPPPSVIYSNSNNRVPERNDGNKDQKNKDGNDSKTQTISSNIRIKDSSASNNKGYNNYESNSRQAPSSSSDFTQPHYRME